MMPLFICVICMIIGLFIIHDAIFRLEEEGSSVSLKFVVGLAITLISVTVGCYFFFFG